MKKSIMVALVALASMAFIGCGGDPLSVWKVSVTENPLVCTADQSTKPLDESNILDGSTWEIYKGSDDTYFLSLGGTVLEGAKDGKTYTFTGERKWHNSDWNPNREVTTTVTYTIVFEVKGNTFTGTYDYSRNVSCRSSSNSCSASDNNICTVTDEIYGVKVDPELRHSTN